MSLSRRLALAGSRQEASGSRQESGRSWVLAALLVLSTFLAYHRVHENGFLWDDPSYLVRNKNLDDLGGLARIWLEPRASPQYYPMVFTTFWLERRLWELAPGGYHVVNVILHALAAVVLGRLLRRLAVPGAWWAAALFAVHPVHVESVAWITERKNVLSGVFYLAAACAWLRFSPPEGGARGAARWAVLAFLAYFAAVASKSITASLPAALLLVAWWKRGRIARSEVLLLLPFFALGAAAGLHTAWLERTHVGASGPEWEIGALERLAIAGRAAWFYAAKLVWPHPLMFFYPRWEPSASFTALLWPASALAVLAALFLARDRVGRGPLVALLYFGGTLFPCLGFFDVYPMRYSFVADHFQYLASIGVIALCVAAGAELARRLDRVLAASVLALAAFGALVVLSWRRVPVFADERALWSDNLARNPSSWAAHNNLGSVLLEDDALEQAGEHFRAALELSPDHPGARNNLGSVYERQGRLDDAERCVRGALELEPDSARFHDNLGRLLLRRNEFSEAMEHLELAVELNPRLPSAHVNMGVLYMSIDDVASATRCFERAVELQPRMPSAHLNLARLYERRGDVPAAVRHYQRALDAGADDEDARHALARLKEAEDTGDSGRD